MGEFWLLDRHGADGPSALVETNGSMQIVDVVKFGPTVTKLEDQQKIWDDVIGKVAPTMKPLVAASKLNEPGTEVHEDLDTGDAAGGSRRNRKGGDEGSAGRGVGNGPKRTGGRGRG